MEHLCQTYDFRVHMGAPESEGEWRKVMNDADACLLGSTLDDSVLRDVPTLRLVSFTGMGVANFVNLDLARQKGVAVSNTPGYGNASVSEHALALLLALARRVVEGDRLVRGGQWIIPSGMQLAGRVAGILGYGGIGAATARLFAAVGMNVLVWTRTRPDTAPPGIRFVPLETLLEHADVLSLHLPLNDRTRGILSGAHLDRLRPGVIIINTARAELIEPGALEARLQAGRLAAGLDVFAHEPLEPDSPLRSLPNVVLSPHQGYNTPAALQRLLAIAADNVDAFFTGRTFHRA
nr:NAD(P)-dependent oxidoreductase [Komagataeibacter sp. FNDCF1]